METQAQQLDTKIELINESADPIAPRDAREDSLFEVWRKVLGRDDLGVEDNFFERGGDSIMAMQIIAGARREGRPVHEAQRSRFAFSLSASTPRNNCK